ncbi:MAG TPA: Crp/Fnr family transcriptional regulator [Magnetospirillaceae bacterium]|nr:Crp/Fnr family transcriptional regulator [Magnetospirillaceae bacterium]
MDEGSIEDIALFADLPPPALAEIQQRCRWAIFQEGDVVFDRDSDTLDVYFVVAGSVRILNTANADRDVALADIPVGNYFGELAAIDGLRRSARVVALEPSRLASLEGRYFFELMRTYPTIAVKVLERLTRIIRDLDYRVTQIASQSESQRIWAQLLRLAEPSEQPDSWIIRDVPNHKEIAAWSGTSREQVAQAIGDLARDGVIRRRSMDLIIQDLPRLQLMVSKATA